MEKPKFDLYRSIMTIGMFILALLGWSIQRNVASVDATIDTIVKVNERQTDTLVSLQINQQDLVSSIRELGRVNAAQDNRLDRMDERERRR